ncbi:MAG TPA: flagellar basal body P-ring protein FlgI, partial [Terriglobales bacterium]|nr:flagellar basal body P-ring protein FlgI [Terriglobales bacterium]
MDHRFLKPGFLNAGFRNPRVLKFAALVGVLLMTRSAGTVTGAQTVLVRDITTIAGVRDNPLVGYSIVVGLNGTGDRQQTLFTTQTLANIMQRMGVQIPASSVIVKNIAAVFVTASLPPFARPGMSLDVTVSSIGDAKSLEGGVLLLAPLHGPDGQVYAEAQGPLTLGGYSAGGSGTTKQLNHPTVGRIPNGGTVERDTSVDLNRMSTVSLVLRNADFTSAREVSGVINRQFGKPISTVVDSRQINVNISSSGIASVPDLISQIQNLSISVHPPAKVVVNERTGTIVMGGDVKLSAVSVLHGGLTVEVATTFTVSQPAPFSKTGQTMVVPEKEVQANETSAKTIRLEEGASVEELINGLQTMGATARDIVAILQAIKAAGGLQAELEIL